jgi:hypothetical protein
MGASANGELLSHRIFARTVAELVLGVGEGRLPDVRRMLARVEEDQRPRTTLDY